jgi:hypothetical protein
MVDFKLGASNIIIIRDGFAELIAELKCKKPWDKNCWRHDYRACQCEIFNLIDESFFDKLYEKVLDNLSKLTYEGIRWLAWDQLDYSNKISFFDGLYDQIAKISVTPIYLNFGYLMGEELRYAASKIPLNIYNFDLMDYCFRYNNSILNSRGMFSLDLLSEIGQKEYQAKKQKIIEDQDNDELVTVFPLVMYHDIEGKIIGVKKEKK